MALRNRSRGDAQLDVVEAIKRAFIRRGFVPRKRLATPDRKTESKKSDDKLPAPPGDTKPPMPVHSDSEEVEPAEGPEKLVDLTANSHEILLEASTVFPLTLFPDTVTVDREKITIANRAFFKVATINSVPITDVQSVEANVGPFFGSLKFLRINMAPMPTPLTVKFLWRDDALKIQRLLQGYIIAHQKEVDCTTIDKEQLIVLLNDLGQGVSD